MATPQRGKRRRRAKGKEQEERKEGGKGQKGRRRRERYLVPKSIGYPRSHGLHINGMNKPN
jgi:hypothetical protein